MAKRIVIVVPCFNEASRLSIPYWKEMICLDLDVNWVFVNDGSTDRTGEILEEITVDNSAEIIHCSENLGKGNAIRVGFMESLYRFPECEVLGYLDSDGAFSKLDVLRLVNKVIDKTKTNSIGSLDVLLSSRVALAGHDIRRKPSRHYIGRIIATYLTNSWTDAPYDTQCGFKLFTKSVAFENSLQRTFQTSWFIDVELMMRIGVANGGLLKIWEEPLTSWHDVTGSKLTVKQIPKLIWEIRIARKEIKHLIRKRAETNGSY